MSKDSDQSFKYIRDYLDGLEDEISSLESENEEKAQRINDLEDEAVDLKEQLDTKHE